MKGEYVQLEEKKDHSSNSSRNSMFGKLHPPQNFQQNPSHHHFHHPSFQISRECQNSEEADSTTADKNDALTPQPVSAIAPPPPPPPSSDGATIEVVRRPRGRPPGSKNRPKPPVIITRDAEPSMSPYILEIPIGVDIINSITKFCRTRNMGLCVLNGSGTVTNVTLRQPSTTPVSTVTFHGRFDILSISATIVQPNASVPSNNNGIANGFTISLAGPQGQVVGGGVVGPLVTAGTVYLVAATFNSPSFHKLPVEEELGRNSGGGGGNEGSGRQSPPPHTVVSGGEDSGHPPTTTAPESCGMSMYSCHLPSDVIWAPTARQPPPPPPPY
ncbi:AT-hook motif nuclear-localized protein 28-like [Nicotiana tabacum]|uniref:AT-hook motif nuclear-localized protein n=1 Tax=Nicotiana tabacum TaxID=4097 RepID=A0A1S3YB19_TOBAC|nr:AT-hook motif nuclear-localized protein 17-like [Nicotiana tomentosiformis]XP_016449304.1 PREDICTED: AT-hook motif nuclear-localized protein 17-like [Nicotiana tabacum]